MTFNWEYDKRDNTWKFGSPNFGGGAFEDTEDNSIVWYGNVVIDGDIEMFGPKHSLADMRKVIEDAFVRRVQTHDGQIPEWAEKLGVTSAEDKPSLVEWTTQVYSILLDTYGIFYDRDCLQYRFPMVYWWNAGKRPEETANTVMNLMNNYSPQDEYILDLAKLRS